MQISGEWLLQAERISSAEASAGICMALGKNSRQAKMAGVQLERERKQET